MVDLDAEYDVRARALRYEGTVTDARGLTFEMRALVVGREGWVNSPVFGTGASGCWLAMDEDTARDSASDVTGGLIGVLESVRFGTSGEEAVGYLPLELAVRLLPGDVLGIPWDLGYTRARVPVDVVPKGRGLTYSMDLVHVSRALVGISAIPPRRQTSLRGHRFTAEVRPGGVHEPFRRPAPEDVMTVDELRHGVCEVV